MQGGLRASGPLRQMEREDSPATSVAKGGAKWLEDTSPLLSAMFLCQGEQYIYTEAILSIYTVFIY